MTCAFFVSDDRQGMIVRSNRHGFYTIERMRDWLTYGAKIKTYCSIAQYETRDAAIDDWFAPYALPGGYPVAFYPISETSGDIEGDVLCASCARQEYTEAGTQFVRQVEDGDHESDLYCDNCHEVIAEQNL